MTEKLHKVLAQMGLGSRRTMEEWIKAGRVLVNGKPAQLGDRVDESAEIKVDGRRISRPTQQELTTRVILYHKPAGEICSRADEEDRPTVFANLPRLKNARWISIGRLDLNTSGLLLFTNDGVLAHKLMHPSSEIEREYAVRVLGEVDDAMLTRLQRGVKLEDGMAHFDSMIDVGGSGVNHWYHVIVKEGRNRLVRRIWESQGLKVSRLIRVRFGTISLPRSVRPGKWQELDPAEVKAMLA
jgi:23S rRNA pseudouridine2605 synthase